MNDPKNKDQMAEVLTIHYSLYSSLYSLPLTIHYTQYSVTIQVMFETFNVPGLHIAVQAVLALVASWSSKKAHGRNPMTGLVVDSGDGVTHIIPVHEGYVIGSCIKHIPIAGKNMTEFIYQMQKDRENIPASEAKRIARETKENCCYTCKDMLKEFRK